MGKLKSLTFSTRNVKKKKQRANQAQPPNHPSVWNLCEPLPGQNWLLPVAPFLLDEMANGNDVAGGESRNISDFDVSHEKTLLLSIIGCLIGILITIKSNPHKDVYTIPYIPETTRFFSWLMSQKMDKKKTFFCQLWGFVGAWILSRNLT